MLEKILSIISNKGGVGKTLFSIELANFIGASGKRVLLIDTDINTGDLTVKLDLNVNLNLLDFFEKKEADLSRLIIHKYNIDIIPGAGGHFKFANLNYFQKMKFIKAFKKISKSYDYTILDLGAGIERTILDFGLTADYPIIITTPEDVQAGYGCAKAAAVRMKELDESIRKRDPDYNVRREFRPLFVLNKSSRQMAEGIISGIKRATQITSAKDDVHIYPDLLGAVPADYRLVSKAYMQQHIPISEKYPSSKMGLSYRQMAQSVMRIDNQEPVNGRVSPLEKVLKLFRYEQE